MKVILRDKTEIYITEDQAEKLNNELMLNDNGFVQIGNQTVRKDRIVEIRTGGLQAADIPDFNKPNLPTGKVCRGTHSIQADINRMAQDESPKGWAKLIRDKKWREEMRQLLRETGGPWCDYRASECACE